MPLVMLMRAAYLAAVGVWFAARLKRRVACSMLAIVGSRFIIGVAAWLVFIVK